MSTWADVVVNGLSVGGYQNHHDNWFFQRSDRVREGCELDINGELADTAFIGYRATTASIRRRMTLHGYDMLTCEDNFNENLRFVIEAAEWVLRYETEHTMPPERPSQSAEAYLLFLNAVKNTTLQDWLNALPGAVSLSKEIRMTNDFYGNPYWRAVSCNPLINAMLSDIPLYTEYPHTGLFNFPCNDGCFFQLAYLTCCPDDAICELNIAPFIKSGYEEDFRDLDEIQQQETQPHNLNRQSIEEIQALSATQPENLSLQRMCYSSIITAMEAYLSDILKREIYTRPAIKERFVANYEPFRKQKFTLSEIYTKLSAIDAEIKDALDGLSLHKIDTAKNIFGSTLLTDFPEESVRYIGAAVKIRHDIVHRNGRNKDGIVLSIYQQDVENLAREVLSLTHKVDAQILDGLLLQQESDKDSLRPNF